MKEKIYLASPHMGGAEMKYIKDAFDKNWVAPLGENVDKFEIEMQNYVGVNYALALSCGTAAIHMAIIQLGVGLGDYVFCSSLTFSASCNPILYEKAIPIFIDSDESWNMSPIALKKAFKWAKKENKMPKAVIVVDLYGQSAKWDEILPVCEMYEVPVIEDAAEALGCKYKDRQCGGFGQFGILSFNGNKIITTSGGGMIFTKTEEERNLIFKRSTQSREVARHYEHKEIGYNYRMSNICAGIGRGQLEVLNERINKKIEIYNMYKSAFKEIPVKMMSDLEETIPTHWLSCMTINKDSKVSPESILIALERENIEARPVWKPMHLQPVFAECKYFTHFEDVSYCDSLFENGICLPSDTKMDFNQQQEIIDIIVRCFK